MEVYIGRGCWWGLSPEFCHCLRVCAEALSWPSHDGCVHRPGLGEFRYVLTNPVCLGTSDTQVEILYLVASLVALLTILAYKDSIIADNFNQSQHVDHCWRVLIGLGCVPGTIALYFRLTIPETPRFTMDIERDVQRASVDIQNMLSDRGPNIAMYWVEPDAIVQRAEAPRRSRRDIIRYFGQSNNLRLLFGVAYSWFAIDASFPFIYGNVIGIADLHHRTALGRILWPWSQFIIDFVLNSPGSGGDRRGYYPFGAQHHPGLV